MANHRGVRAWKLLLAGVLIAAGFGDGSERTAYLLRIDGAIGPMTYHQIARVISLAERKDAECVILVIDTPGGLLTSTRKAVKAILDSAVPVVGYVGPQGSQCASAGTFIALACHLVAMAPATNIGAAHPVTLMGSAEDKTMEKKAVNDTVSFIRSIALLRKRNAAWAEKAVRESASATAEEALRMGVIDLVARNTGELLARIDGAKVETRTGMRTLATSGIAVRESRVGLREKLLGLISDPNIAYILLIIGIWGIILEFSHPGSGVPGIVGTLCIILALFALQTIPISLTGVILIFVSLVFFAIEAMTPTFGLFMTAGIISLVLGSFMFVKPGSEAGISSPLIWGATASSGLVLGAVVWFAGSARRRKITTGSEGLKGECGKAVTDLDPAGMVFVHGEYWRARSRSGTIPKDAEIRVVDMDGLVAIVERCGAEP